MTMAAPLELRIGDRLRLRKEHPCGSRDWEVVRLGADIGLVCAGCGHRILMDRLDVERRFTELPRSRSDRDSLEPMAHVELPPGRRAGDLTGAGTVFRNRVVRLPVVGPDAEPAGQQHGPRRAHGDRAAHDRVRHRRRGPDPHFPRAGGALQHARRRACRAQQRAHHHARHERGAGRSASIAFIFVAPSTATANVPLIYLINFGIATATAVFAPAELTAIPRIVERRHLMAANSIFVLTINATFAIGFGFLGPLVLNVLGPVAVYVIVAVMFGASALAILPLPAVRPETVAAPATAAAGRAIHELIDQLKEGVGVYPPPSRHRMEPGIPRHLLQPDRSARGHRSRLRGRHPGPEPGELLLHHGPGRNGRRAGHPLPELVWQGHPEATGHRHRPRRDGCHARAAGNRETGVDRLWGRRRPYPGSGASRSRHSSVLSRSSW